jgi:hypothetical protein
MKWSKRAVVDSRSDIRIGERILDLHSTSTNVRRFRFESLWTMRSAVTAVNDGKARWV